MSKEYLEREAVIGFLENMAASRYLIQCFESKEKFPAADVVELRHGQWIHNEKTFSNGLSYHRWTCSLCGRVVARKDEADIEDLPYCNCGAKMDGGK